MLIKILKVKEWQYHNKILNTLHEYFELSKIPEYRQKRILERYNKILISGKMNKQIMETLNSLERAVEIWKKRLRNS